jgi:hypothetical protein
MDGVDVWSELRKVLKCLPAIGRGSRLLWRLPVFSDTKLSD